MSDEDFNGDVNGDFNDLAADVAEDVRADLVKVFTAQKRSRSPRTGDSDEALDLQTEIGVTGQAVVFSPRQIVASRIGRVHDRWQKRKGRRSAQEVEAVLESRPMKVDADGKKRVVIADDSVVTDAKGAGGTRFRQRRIAVRRAEGRRRLRWFGLVGIVLVAVMVTLLLLVSPILSIRKVDVEGAVYTNPERLAQVVASLDGKPILTADLHGAQKRLLAIAWVRDARVSMHLPSRVTIEIVERQPIAFFRAVDGFNRVIDVDGRVLDVIEGEPTLFTPIVGTGPNLSAGDMAGQPFLGAAQLINALPLSLRQRLLLVSVDAQGGISLTLSGNVEVIFGPPNDFQIKLVGVINEIKRQGSDNYSVIDVSTGEPSVR